MYVDEGNICSLCDGTGRLFDNIAKKQYKCPRCLGTGRNILRRLLRIIQPRFRRGEKRND